MTHHQPKWIKDLDGSYVVEYSSRLRNSLGRCRPESNRISLHPRLRSELAHLHAEVVCHELAHLAVYRQHGRAVRPHGPEWKALVREAGFEPRRMVMAMPEPGDGAVYEHRCPVCQMTRVSRRRQKRWRCAHCVEIGLGGLLVISKA